MIVLRGHFTRVCAAGYFFFALRVVEAGKVCRGGGGGDHRIRSRHERAIIPTQRYSNTFVSVLLHVHGVSVSELELVSLWMLMRVYCNRNGSQ